MKGADAMSERNLAKAFGGRQYGPEQFLYTTADAARVLQVTPRWVRWLARHQELPHAQTGSGLWLFREADVLQIAARRAKARGRPRREWLVAMRPQMLHASGAPRQSRFRLVRTA